MEATAFQKLNDLNWAVWKFQIKVILMSKGLYDLVVGSNMVLPQDKDELQKWRVNDARAQEVLVTRMEEGAIKHVMQCQSASEMWKKLECVYERKSELSLHLLNEQFCNLKFENSDSITSFYTRFNNIVGKIQEIGEAIPANLIITKIIMALPEQYKHFKSAWESVPKDAQTMDNLLARLLIEEERYRKEENEEVALV